jgi:DNA-directed RNA polymerase subunit RPC12/RpoP
MTDLTLKPTLEDRIKVADAKAVKLLRDANTATIKFLELEARLERECTWTEPTDWDYGGWTTTCGEEWAFTEGDPEENRVNFCQGCGGKVIIKLKEQGDE